MPEDGERTRQAEERYREALEARGVRDVRPLYRKLLRQLRERDAGAYEAAVARYEAEVARPVAEGADPLPAWLGYGRWLAERLAPGAVVAVDGTGRSSVVEGEAPLDRLILHLPGKRRERAILLSAPREWTDPQRETAELLCG